MKKIIILFCILLSFSSYAEIYSPDNMKEVKEMVEDVFKKRNPEKTIFIFPLENFILQPIPTAMQKQNQNYNSLLKRAFSDAKLSKTNYISELVLLDYPHELSDPAIIDLIDYIQKNNSAVIIITPNLTGGINKIDFFDVWTFGYLKSKKIDLAKGIFADKKFIFDKYMKKIDGTYPTFYKGLLSYNTDNKDNSAMQALSVLFAAKLNKIPDVIVALSDSKDYLEALEKQLKILKEDNEFFGILYTPKPPKTAEISPEDYLRFWQNFVKNLNKVTRKEIDPKSENPYEQ